MKYLLITILFIAFNFNGCGGGGGSSSNNNQQTLNIEQETQEQTVINMVINQEYFMNNGDKIEKIDEDSIVKISVDSQTGLTSVVLTSGNALIYKN